MATERKYLDSEERFGFMKRGRAASCVECGVGLKADDTRLYDNERKRGPLCTPCCRREAVDTGGTPRTQRASAETPQEKSRMPQLEQRIKRIEDFLKETDNVNWLKFTQDWRPPTPQD